MPPRSGHGRPHDYEHRPRRQTIGQRAGSQVGSVPGRHHRQGKPRLGSNAGLRWRAWERGRELRVTTSESRYENGERRRGLADEPVDANPLGQRLRQKVWRYVRGVGVLARARVVVR